MAIADRLSGIDGEEIDVCRAKRNEQNVSMFDEFAAVDDALVGERDGLRQIVAGKRTMEIVATVTIAVKEKIVGIIRLAVNNIINGAANRQRVVNHARRIDEAAKFCIEELPPDVVGETRPNEHQPRIVTD